VLDSSLPPFHALALQLYALLWPRAPLEARRLSDQRESMAQ
jgi:hypothetical protein